LLKPERAATTRSSSVLIWNSGVLYTILDGFSTPLKPVEL
jgi:hypothetical protein